jgi:1,4-dihydroxy-2-naphthoate octaprenyltransferase
MLLYEYAISALFLVLSIISGPWYLKLVALPLVLYNIRSYKKRDYKLYFITKKEYG